MPDETTTFDAHRSAAVRVLPTEEEASAYGATSFADHAARAIEETGRFTVALSGGETPRRMYEMLAEGELVRTIAWDRVHLFWGDERGVPPDHPRSNFRMTNEAFVGRVPIPRDNVHRMRGELAAEAAAVLYATELASVFGTEGRPRFDLIHLGLGDDGHTASLFPGHRALGEGSRLVVATRDASHGDEPRITFTLPLINAARRVEVLVLEPEKAEVVRRALCGSQAADVLPIRGVAPRGEYQWILSAAAAGALPERGGE